MASQNPGPSSRLANPFAYAWPPSARLSTKYALGRKSRYPPTPPDDHLDTSPIDFKPRQSSKMPPSFSNSTPLRSLETSSNMEAAQAQAQAQAQAPAQQQHQQQHQPTAAAAAAPRSSGRRRRGAAAGSTSHTCPHCGRSFKRSEHKERHVRTRQYPRFSFLFSIAILGLWACDDGGAGCLGLVPRAAGGWWPIRSRIPFIVHSTLRTGMDPPGVLPIERTTPPLRSLARPPN